MNALSFVLITFVVRWFTRERRILTFGNLWVLATLAIFAHLLFTWFTQVMAGLHFQLHGTGSHCLAVFCAGPSFITCCENGASDSGLKFAKATGAAQAIRTGIRYSQS